MTAKMQIEWDEGAGFIRVGKWQVDKFYDGKRSNGFEFSGSTPPWKRWVRDVADDNGIHLPYHPKEFSKAAAEMFGRAPKAMYEHYKALAYKAFVVPHQHILKKVAFAPGRINHKWLAMIKKNQNVAQQVYDDGLYNLLPIVVQTGNSPKFLKAHLGRTWKVLSKNSLSKNKAVAEFAKEFFPYVCDKPTTVLKDFAKTTSQYYNPNVEKFLKAGYLEHVELHYKGKWSDSREMSRVMNMFFDTVNLAEQLDRKVDAKWTPRRLKEEHDQMAKDINALRYPKTPFPWMGDLEPRALQVGDYTATLLDNACAIAEEGSAMGHCVGLYAGSSKAGEYVVYSVTKGGERISTIGITRCEIVQYRLNERNPAGYEYRFNQHYGRFNSIVKDEVEKSIPDMLLNILNKKEEQA